MWLAWHAKHIALAGAPQRRLDIADPVDVSAATQANGTSAAIARSIICDGKRRLGRESQCRAGTCAAAIRAGSSVQALGRYSARSMKAWPWRDT